MTTITIGGGNRIGKTYRLESRDWRRYTTHGPVRIRIDRAGKLRRAAFWAGYALGRFAVGPLAARSADHGAHLREGYRWLDEEKGAGLPAP